MKFAILAHFASPGYAPVTIAVSVTRLERGFNACKTPRCIYPSIFNRFWDIASYWSKIATFLYPTSVLRPRRGWPRPRQNVAKILIHTKLDWMGYRVVKKSWRYVQPFWYNTSVWQTGRQTDGRTDRRTDVQPISITCFSIADVRKNYTEIFSLLICKAFKRFVKVIINKIARKQNPA